MFKAELKPKPGEEPCTDLAPVLDVLVEPCGVSMFWVLVNALPMLWLPPEARPPVLDPC